MSPPSTRAPRNFRVDCGGNTKNAGDMEPNYLASKAGECPQLETPALVPVSTYGVTSSKGKGCINLKGVADVLMERGLNPTEELIRILVDGNLDDDVKARLYKDLIEYVAPKLKAIEISGNIGIEMTPEQVDQRIAYLLEQSQGLLIDQ